MFIFLWVLLRLTLIFGTIFILSLWLVLRAMARRISEDRRLSGKTSSGFKRITSRGLGAAIAILIGLGVRRHQWGAAVTGCCVVLGFVGILWLDRFKQGAISRPALTILETGPASAQVWFRAAAVTAAVLLLDTFVTGEWRFSPGLLTAFIWCLACGLFSRHLGQRAQIQARA